MQAMLSLSAVQIEDLTGLEVRVSHRTVFEASLAYLGLPRVSPDVPAVPDMLLVVHRCGLPTSQSSAGLALPH